MTDLLKRVEAALVWMDAKGGLGHDVHARIDQSLADVRAAIAESEAAQVSLERKQGTESDSAPAPTSGTIKRAIAALEHAQDLGSLPDVTHDISQALALLRSIPGPATEGEMRKHYKEIEYSLDRWIDYELGFRASERRIFGGE